LLTYSLTLTHLLTYSLTYLLTHLFSCSGSAGMFATCCIQPIDMIKVRIQLTGELGSGKTVRNPFTVGAKFVKEEGLIIYSYTHILIYSYTHILIYSYSHAYILTH